MATPAYLAIGKLLCNHYKVNYRFSTRHDTFARPYKGYIHVDKTLYNEAFLSGVLHEIQHCINYRTGKYKAFHEYISTAKILRRWALPAEIYTDKQAKKLGEKFGFNKYVTSYYNNKRCKDFLNNWIDNLKEVKNVE